MEGWRQWQLGRTKTYVQRKNNPTHLTPTGLLMEGVSTNRELLVKWDLSPLMGTVVLPASAEQLEAWNVPIPEARDLGAFPERRLRCSLWFMFLRRYRK